MIRTYPLPGSYFYQYFDLGVDLDFGKRGGALKIIFFYGTAAHGRRPAEAITDKGVVPGDSLSKIVDLYGLYPIGYQHNPIGQLSNMTYPSGNVIANQYDLRARVIGEAKVSGTQVLTQYVGSVAYNSAQQVTGETVANGIAESYTYNSRLQLTGQTAQVGTGSTYLMNLTYNYQAPAGASGVDTQPGDSGQLMSIGTTAQPAKIAQQNRNETFTYDNLGRLSTATGWGAFGEQYQYDQWSNLTGINNTLNNNAPLQTIAIQQTPPGSGVPTNQISTVTSTLNGATTTATYSYDLSGNVTSDGAHNYVYDAEGRLAKVDPGTTNEFDYSYDINNWRVAKAPGSQNVSGATTYYVWNNGQVIAEYSNAPVSAIAPVMYYFRDKLSTRLITDPDGDVLGTEDVKPFGGEAGTSGVTEKHRFTNYERDSETSSTETTGTDYAVNRQYSNTMARFMQPDRLSGSITNPQSLNRYAYSLNDPKNVFDPTGNDDDSDGGAELDGGGDDLPISTLSLNEVINLAPPVDLSELPLGNDSTALGPNESITVQAPDDTIPTTGLGMIFLQLQFQLFLQPTSSASISGPCADALAKIKSLGASYASKLVNQLANTTFYNVNNISQTMKQQFGSNNPGAGPNQTVAAWFNSLGVGAQVTEGYKSGNGIYIGGSAVDVFHGDMYFLLHELTEEAVGGSGDTDQNVARAIGGIGKPTGGQTWSSVMSNYFNSGCTNTNHPKP
jgi:RHS repeat-associated protein